MSDISLIKKSLEAGKIIIGRDRVFKNLKLGNVSTVLVSSNCPEDFLNDVNHYSKVFKVEVTTLDVPNVELGVLCRKPFAVSMVAVIK